MKASPALALASVLILATAACFTARAGQDTFRDPLQVPAMASALAGTSPLMGVARAGRRLVAVGIHGDVVYSDDRGQHWKQASVPVSTDLTAVYFPTARQGWAVGHEGVILHSTDAGRSWHLQLNGWQAARLMVRYYQKRVNAGDDQARQPLRNAELNARQAPALAFLGVWFKNARVGYVVGEFNILLKTTDGGKTWIPLSGRTQNPNSYHLYSVRGSQGHLYIAGERGLFLRLDHSTHSFVALKTPYQGSYFGVAARGRLVALFGLRGHAYISHDAGRHWHKAETETRDTFTGGLIRHGRIILVTEAGGIFYSDDKGRTFKAVPLSTPRAIYGIAADGRGRVALVGASGLWSETLNGKD